MKNILRSVFFLLCALTVLEARPPSLLFQGSADGKVALNNRILATFNEKSITMLDVMQKMTLFLQKNYPDQAKSPLARSQFFISSWRDFLHQMIDQELILADAKRIELKVTDKDVREALLARFGPNIMTTLDEINLSFEKAKELIYNEIVIERMTWFRVHSKTFEKLSPKLIKEAYKEYLVNNPPIKELVYQVLSIRSQDAEEAHALAKQAHALLTEGSVPFASIEERLKSTESASVTLSSLYRMKESELSDAHRSALEVLPVQGISPPMGQTSRYDGGSVVRIFFLKQIDETHPRPFQEMEKELKDHLFSQIVSEKTQEYVAKLREQFGYSEDNIAEILPEDYQPFVVQ